MRLQLTNRLYLASMVLAMTIVFVALASVASAEESPSACWLTKEPSNGKVFCNGITPRGTRCSANCNSTTPLSEDESPVEFTFAKTAQVSPCGLGLRSADAVTANSLPDLRAIVTSPYGGACRSIPITGYCLNISCFIGACNSDCKCKSYLSGKRHPRAVAPPKGNMMFLHQFPVEEIKNSPNCCGVCLPSNFNSCGCPCTYGQETFACC